MGQVLLPQNCLVQTSLLQYSFSLLSGTCPQETLIPSSPCTSNKHQVAGPWQQHPASHSVQVSHQDTSHVSCVCLHLHRRHLETSWQMKARHCQKAGCSSWDSLSKAPSAYRQEGTEGRKATLGLCNLLQLPTSLHVGYGTSLMTWKALVVLASSQFLHHHCCQKGNQSWVSACMAFVQH